MPFNFMLGSGNFHSYTFHRYAVAIASVGLAFSIGLGANQPILAQEPEAQLAQKDFFRDGMYQANRAHILSQSARTAAEWNEVAKLWIQAVAAMQNVPMNSSKRALAEKKVVEYMRNFAYSQERAAISSNLSYPTFNSDILDRQLELYLSYIEAFGVPDVMIVGSSRALQGLDPSALQQALASRGKTKLKFFNFGINGATARVVEFQLQQLLSVEQLPRQIVWADGLRAFNSGRTDRTYNEIISSPGYQRLASGIRPSLTSAVSEANFARNTGENAREDTGENAGENYKWAPEYSYKPGMEDGSGSARFSATAELAMVEAIADLWSDEIDANGFKPVSQRFNPAIYYRRHRRVPGRYDLDYDSFWLGGEQEAALLAVVSFARARKIPLLVVGLPLTWEYLDWYRSGREQQFRQYMQRQARNLGFAWRDLSQGNLSRNDYFQDPSHLNRYGAAAVARALAADTRLTWPEAR